MLGPNNMRLRNKIPLTFHWFIDRDDDNTDNDTDNAIELW